MPTIGVSGIRDFLPAPRTCKSLFQSALSFCPAREVFCRHCWLFPIVVIEGTSEDMDEWTDAAAEQRMWQRRKELYICSSRATAFLFLVGSDGNAKQEFAEIVRQFSAPEKDENGFPRTWRFRVTQSAQTERRKVDVFTDASEG